MSRKLPQDFLLGCATSAYQVEGGIDNDWAAWAQAGRLKSPDARCGRASDHWARWSEDFDLLKDLGADAYRFSVEWARVEPRPGEYDEAALAQYGRMVAGLRERGIEPCVTLLHFTHPRWFHQTSPWHRAGGGAVERFVAFVGKVLDALGGQATMFTVLNEPGVWLSAAYLSGVVPPGQKSVLKLFSAGTQLLRAHAAATARIRARVPAAKVGVAHNVLRFVPSRASHPLDRLMASYADDSFNRAIPRAFETGRWQLGKVPGIRRVEHLPELVGSIDFLGVNYYTRAYLETSLQKGLEVFYEDRGDLGVTDLGWEVHPEGMKASLREMAELGLPLYVTENGLDDRDDSRRAGYLYDHLDAVLECREAGLDIRGYFHWSLMDNFEWLEAFEPRFGLFHVDYDSYARSETSGARLFRAVATDRALPAERPPFTPRRKPGRTAIP